MNHEYNGQGGSYVIGDKGDLVLVERTQEHAPAPRPATTKQNPQPEPADAGFFPPVAPADQSTTE